MAWQVGFGNAANFVSSNVFIKGQAPRYPVGFTTGLVFTCVGFCLVSLGAFLLAMMNKKREARRAGMSEEEREADDEVYFKFHL